MITQDRNITIQILALIIFLVVNSFGVSLAQVSEFNISGKLKVDGGSNSDAKITIEKNGKRVKVIDGTSKFEIALDFDAVYTLAFEKEGFVTKRLRFDTHVPEGRLERELLPFEFVVEIFEQYDDVNLVVFNQPVGQISFNEDIDEFDYDTDYTKSIQLQLEQALEEVAVKKEEKLKLETEKRKQEEIDNKQVANLKATAEKNLSAGKYDDAIKDLEEALRIKEEEEVKNLLENAKEKLVQENARNQKQKDYDEKIKLGKDQLEAGKIDLAKNTFLQAKEILKDDPEAEKYLQKIADLENQKKINEEKIAKALDEARRALNESNFDQAKAKAKEAESLGEMIESNAIIAKADEEIEKRLLNQKAQEEKLKTFEKIIAQSESAMKALDLDVAQNKLEEARLIIPDDARIDQIQRNINAKKQEILINEKAQLENFNSALDEAKAKLASGDFFGAETALQKAKDIKSNQETEILEKQIIEAKEMRVNQVRTALEEEKILAEKQKKFNKAMANAESAYSKKDFSAAIELANQAISVGLNDSTAPELKRKAEISLEENLQKKANEDRENQISALLQDAKSSMLDGDLDAAEKSYQKILAVDSSNFLAKEGLENIIKKRDNIAQAEKEKIEQEFINLINEGKAAKTDSNWQLAKNKFEKALVLKSDKTVEDLLREVNADIEKSKQKAEELKSIRAAEALAAQSAREKDQLAKIMEEEAKKSSADLAKQIITQQSSEAKPPAKSVEISKVQYGQEAINASPMANLSDDDKFDAQQSVVSRQQAMYAEELRQIQLKEKYKEHKTTEIEIVGNSTITYVYINRGDFVTVFKKVEHKWGGVFYFVDEKSTNQRYWEFSTN